MKSVLISIQPYYVFLIIAKIMGWDIGKEKKVEVRKNYPKDENWDKIAKIYCSKSKKSFNRIPKEYQLLMKQFLGKVIGEFVCDKIYQYSTAQNVDGINITDEEMTKASCLTKREIGDYEFSAEAKENCIYKIGVYGWHISDLVIYDKPRELSEFTTPEWFRDCEKQCDDMERMRCPTKDSHKVDKMCDWCRKGGKPITRPPQSWCYVESEGNI